MNWEAAWAGFGVVLQLLQGVATVAVWFYVRARERNAATKQRIDILETDIERRNDLLETDIDLRCEQITERIGQVEKEIGKIPTREQLQCPVHLERLAKVEQKVAMMPQGDDLLEINNRLAALHGDVAKLSGVMEGISRTLNLLVEHHLNPKLA